jgi:hypothetical protein
MFGDLPASGVYLRHVREATLRNVQLVAEASDARAALTADDVAGLHLTSLGTAPGNPTGPVIWLNDVRGGLVQGSVSPDGVAVFVRVTGENTRNLALLGNVYGRAGLVHLAPELAPEAVAQLDGSDVVIVRRSPTS